MRPPDPRAPPGLAVAAAVWAAGALAYLVLAGSLAADELAAAALLGALGAALHRAAHARGARRLAFERPAWRVAGAAVAGLPGATLRVGLALAGALGGAAGGRRIERFFEGGRQGEPRDGGRRAVVVLAASLAPDSFVLRLPLDEDAILYHALTAREPGRDPRWPA